MFKSICSNQHRIYLFALQVLLVVALLSLNFETVCANAVTPEIPAVSDNENEFLMPVDEKDEYSDLYSNWGKRSNREDDLNADMLPVMVFFANPATMDDGDINDDIILNQKRGWKKMNVAWGKRRNAGQLINREFIPSASAAGSWGKREPNWNNLKGMWGKRAITSEMSRKRANSKGEQWNYLRGSWGKRSPQFPETN